MIPHRAPGRRFAGRVIVMAFAAAIMLCAPAAFAQSSPSADQIIQSLKPTPGQLGGPTRGLRMLPATPAPSTSSASSAPRQTSPAVHQAANRQNAPAPAETAGTGGAPSIDLNVEFRTGSAELTPQAIHTLDNLGQALTSADLANYRFRIAGHTDTVGTPEQNKTLSERRAQAVAIYLEQRFNVAPQRLETVGVGEDDLAVPTGPQVPNPRNRRVQVINMGA